MNSYEEKGYTSAKLTGSAAIEYLNMLEEEIYPTLEYNINKAAYRDGRYLETEETVENKLQERETFHQ